MKKAVFLFDKTGIMAKPWADAGYLCYCFDGQHEAGVSKSEHENTLNVGMWFNHDSIYKHVEDIKMIVGDGVELVFGFPECTDLTVAGARHFKAKAEKNPNFQKQAIELCDLVRCVGEKFNCKWGFENPKWNVLQTQYRKADFDFNPCDYGGYLPDDDKHPLYSGIYPPRDAYNKGTSIWCGNGFIEPIKKPVEPASKDNPGWLKLGGKSLKTKNIRSATLEGLLLQFIRQTNDTTKTGKNKKQSRTK